MAEKNKEPAEKPLEKMTVKELREIAKEIPDISGVHGMNKAELYTAVCKARGIEERQKKKKAEKIVESVKHIKERIRALKVEREAALRSNDARKANIYKRRISKLKKKTRKAA